MSLKDVSALDLEALAVREAASYHATLSCKIHVQNVNGSEIETLAFSPNDHPMIPLVTETYRAMREQYKASDDLSIWFSQTIVPAVGGIGKRSRGGVYYVHASRRDLIMKVSQALDLVSSSTTIDRTVNGMSAPVSRLAIGGKLCIEPRFADDTFAMEILIDGVIRDTDSALTDLSAALSNPDKKLGKRALGTKKEECLKLEAAMKSWENVCSVSLDLLRNRIAEIQAGIGTAELACDLDDA